jgi:uncharacterized cupredoxin-like copper-binding protein
MVDFGFDMPRTVKAGRSLWRVEGAGEAVHLMFIVRLLPGKSFEDAKRWAEKHDGPMPTEGWARAVGVHALTKGLSNDVELDLAPGEYVVVCPIDGHYLHGMIQPLTVTP